MPKDESGKIVKNKPKKPGRRKKAEGLKVTYSKPKTAKAIARTRRKKQGTQGPRRSSAFNPVMGKPKQLSPLVLHMDEIPKGTNPLDWLRKYQNEICKHEWSSVYGVCRLCDKVKPKPVPRDEDD